MRASFTVDGLSDDEIRAALPRSVRGVADAIGLDAALRLYRALGGLRLYVSPDRPMPVQVVDLLGADAAERLRAALGVGHHEMPKLHRVAVTARHAAVLAAASAGEPHRDIARRLRLTQRRVRAIVAEQQP